MQSSRLRPLVSIELLVLSFCFVKVAIGIPLPIDRPSPVCPLMFGCTANDVYINHFKILLLLLAFRISRNSLFPLTYFIIWTNSCSLTLDVKKTTAVSLGCQVVELCCFFHLELLALSFQYGLEQSPFTTSIQFCLVQGI